jgi:hypothetical protein
MRRGSWFGVWGEVLVASADIYPRVRPIDALTGRTCVVRKGFTALRAPVLPGHPAREPFTDRHRRDEVVHGRAPTFRAQKFPRATSLSAAFSSSASASSRLSVAFSRSNSFNLLTSVECFAVVIEHRSRGIRIAWSNPIQAVTKSWRMRSTSSRKASPRSAGPKACQAMRASENRRPRSQRSTSHRTEHDDQAEPLRADFERRCTTISTNKFLARWDLQFETVWCAIEPAWCPG